jgi:anthranilate/para-aminobenzoate synthase component II
MKNFLLTTACLLLALSLALAARHAGAAESLTPPKLTNNPVQDVIATSSRPLLSIMNGTGGVQHRAYTFEISQDPKFPRASTIVYAGIAETNSAITEKQIEPGDALADGLYYWRARTTDATDAKSAWAQARFYVDVTHSRTWSGFLRAPVVKVTASSGQDPKNLIDWNDQGQLTYWNSSPSGGEANEWVVLDLGKPTPVTRFWMLSNPSGDWGWLTDFVWQSSSDGKNWTDIPGTSTTDSDTYRHIIDFEPVGARYYRLQIQKHRALQAQLNVIIPYTKNATVAAPKVPDKEYVLLIGNQMNGFTYTQLSEFVEKQNYWTITIPHEYASMALIEKLPRKPMAIICSGNNANYPNMPMFEYYGEFEIMRETDIPLLGICCGHQSLAMAYGITYARFMGFHDLTQIALDHRKTPPLIQIVPEHEKDPIFKGMPNPFRSVEIHSWAVSPVSLIDDFEVIAKTRYIQALKSKTRPVYGAQFHGEAVTEYNAGGQYIINFLKLAKSRQK